MTSAELKRWLEKQGCTFGTQEGSHLKVYLGGKQTIVPMHGKKELGLKEIVSITMEYPARFTRDHGVGTFIVSFPDVPEAHTLGDTMEEAMAMAAEALELALTFYTEKWKDLPVPSQPKRGMRMVRVPALSEAKFKLYTALREAGLRKIDLARRMKCAPSQVDRLLDITHHSRLDQLEAAFAAIGKRLSVQIEEAA